MENEHSNLWDLTDVHVQLTLQFYHIHIIDVQNENWNFKPTKNPTAKHFIQVSYVNRIRNKSMNKKKEILCILYNWNFLRRIEKEIENHQTNKRFVFNFYRTECNRNSIFKHQKYRLIDICCSPDWKHVHFLFWYWYHYTFTCDEPNVKWTEENKAECRTDLRVKIRHMRCV